MNCYWETDYKLGAMLSGMWIYVNVKLCVWSVDHLPKLSTQCSKEIKQSKKNIRKNTKEFWNKLKTQLYYSINPIWNTAFLYDHPNSTVLSWITKVSEKGNQMGSLSVSMNAVTSFISVLIYILHLKHEWYLYCFLSLHFWMLELFILKRWD